MADTPIPLEVRNLKKRFGDTEVLKGLSLEARKGDVITLIGASGSGKSIPSPDRTCHLLRFVRKHDSVTHRIKQMFRAIERTSSRPTTAADRRDHGRPSSSVGLMPRQATFAAFCRPGTPLAASSSST